MINVHNYLNLLIELLIHHFGSRLLYVGLQGSYLRDEATSNSDIDIMVIIDGLGVSDLDIYRNIIHSLPHAEKSCGFICSKTDLENWNPLEIAHVLNGTKDYYGVLIDYLPPFDENDIRNFIKLSVNNLYHEICHRYIHDTTESNFTHLPAAFKCTFYILQNLYYLTSQEYISTKSELLQVLNGKNYAVLKRSIDLYNGQTFDFMDSFELLFSWCQETLASL